MANVINPVPIKPVPDWRSEKHRAFHLYFPRLQTWGEKDGKLKLSGYVKTMFVAFRKPTIMYIPPIYITIYDGRMQLIVSL